ncbi:MAG: hypothetical protein IJ124_00795 [Clostridia bacterium]|nr:hypothetical protein [Clostridia bacterium]
MSVLQKMKEGLIRFMAGRHGTDELSLALLIAGVLLSVLTSVTGFFPLYILGLAAYVLSIFRVLSRNTEKRYAENRKFVAAWQRLRTDLKQFINRVKNMRKYKYFKCPECGSRLRLPRKVGEVTVTCGKCHNAFKQKA